jgi:MFS superfamily sulfate permease-like transporter
VAERRRVSERSTDSSLFSSLRELKRSEVPLEFLAGVTLLAIAIPEQLATSQLANVPAFSAMLAFTAATIVFAMLGSNPILSVGADSTIAPLFAVALLRLAASESPHYLSLVSATAVLTGILVLAIGLFRLGWLADFLSMPIIAGFMTGIGIVIMVHQLPHALGLSSVEGSFWHRLVSVTSHLSHVNGWATAISFGTLLLIIVGEKFAPKFPFALCAVLAATALTYFGHLTRHGVATLGTVIAGGPTWRWNSLTTHDLVTVVTTSLTVAIVVLSQTAATTRSVADDLGIGINIDRDFIAVGLANAASGLIGSMPVNASPARTGIITIAGGRTQLVGLIAAGGALLVAPVAPALKDMPLAVLAGVLFFVASRLVKTKALREIARVDTYELILALLTAVVVMFVGVQQGLALAVALAIFDRTRRSARPHLTVLGRKPDTTSWEPLGAEGSIAVDHITVVLFSAPLYFANAAKFRDEVHQVLATYPETKHVVLDAAAMHDIDFTGISTLDDLLQDLQRDGVGLVIARPSHSVVRTLKSAPSAIAQEVSTYDTVDEAVRALST